MRAGFDAKGRHRHPVDVIEKIVHHRALSFERLAEDEISLRIRGQLSDYHIAFSWVEIFETLHIGCAFALTIAPRQRPRMVDLLSLINEKILEHFPKSGNRFLDEKYGKNKELEQFPKSVKRFSDKSCGENKQLEQQGCPLKSPSSLIGYFDYWQDTGEVIYRQNLLLSEGRHPTDAQITTLITTALDVCELHFPACEKVAMSDIPACEALRYAMFETLGHA